MQAHVKEFAKKNQQQNFSKTCFIFESFVKVQCVEMQAHLKEFEKKNQQQNFSKTCFIFESIVQFVKTKI